jgi:hypothetical protein
MVQPFNISIGANGLEGKGTLTFYHSDILAGNEAQTLHLGIRQADSERQMFTHEEVVTNVMQGHLPPTVPLKITYNGMDGKAHSTEMAMEYRSDMLFYQFVKHSTVA